jgi:hypothetical protein
MFSAATYIVSQSRSAAYQLYTDDGRKIAVVDVLKLGTDCLLIIYDLN